MKASRTTCDRDDFEVRVGVMIKLRRSFRNEAMRKFHVSGWRSVVDIDINCVEPSDMTGYLVTYLRN